MNAQALLSRVRRAAGRGLHARARAASRRCSCSRRCSRSKLMPPRAKSVAAVALAVGLSPVAMRGAGDGAGELPTDADRARGPDAQGDARRHGVRVRARRVLRRRVRGRHAARHADRLLLRRARRPGHGQRSRRRLTQLYALVGVAIFIAIGGDGWVIQGLARTYEAVPLLEAPDARLARRGRAGRVQRHLRAPRSRSPRRCCSRWSSPTPRSASSPASSRSSTSSRSASRPRSRVGLVLIGASLPFARRLARRRAAALRRLRPARAEGGG